MSLLYDTLTVKPASRGVGRPDYSAATVANRSTGVSGQLLVVAAGTPIQFPNISIPNGFSFNLLPRPGNAGIVYVQYLVAATLTDRIPLDNGQPSAYPISNASVLYLDADNAGDGVNWTVVQ